MDGLELDKELFNRGYRVRRVCSNCRHYSPVTKSCLQTSPVVPVDADGSCRNYGRDWTAARGRGIIHWLEE